MQDATPFLLISTFAPIASALMVILLTYGVHNVTYNRVVTIIGGLVNILCLAAIYINFDFSVPDLQLNEEFLLLDSLDLSYQASIDGISFSLMLLNGLVDFVSLIAALFMVRSQGFIFCFMLLPGLVNGTFAAQNLLQFFLFFEAALIPMYFMIGIWGGSDRKYAAYKFVLYTLAGSMFFLISIAYIFVKFNTLDMVALQTLLPSIKWRTQFLLCGGMILAMLVKIPTPPFHTWLPDAHVQAPTPSSAILAGILLKLGGYALIRIVVPFFPDTCTLFAPYIMSLSVFAIIYGSFVAFGQTDMKKMIAYSSIAHMGFVTAGIFSMTLAGLQGAMFQMISHGVISSALFLVVGVLYERMHTKKISAYGGVAEPMPNLAFFYLLFTLGAIGLPGTMGFIGEFIVISALFQISWWWSLSCGLGMVLGAIYMLSLYKKVMLGEIRHPAIEKLQDISLSELAILAPLAAVMIWLGINGTWLLDLFTGPLRMIITN